MEHFNSTGNSEVWKEIRKRNCRERTYNKTPITEVEGM